MRANMTAIEKKRRILTSQTFHQLLLKKICLYFLVAESQYILHDDMYLYSSLALVSVAMCVPLLLSSVCGCHGFSTK